MLWLCCDYVVGHHKALKHKYKKKTGLCDKCEIDVFILNK